MDVTPIGIIQSDYKQRFAIPRQPLLVKNASAVIILNKDFSKDCVKGIEDFSHLWVLFHFHNTKGRGWKEVVRPPRLGGKEGRGVFATRSPYRPNSIGMSVVKLSKVDYENGQVHVHVSGGDFLDGTPVVDIKPYVPYVDSIVEATSKWASKEEDRMEVNLSSKEVLSHLTSKQIEAFYEYKAFIFDTLSLDPRPAYERKKDGKSGQSWSVHLNDFDIEWSVIDQKCHIIKITWVEK
jgi:tRNA (adenine37-N6)-methyltransferase